MPELEVIGRVENAEAADVEPLIVPVAARRIPGGEEVVERFSFRPTEPIGAMIELHRHTNVEGVTPFKYVWEFLDECLLSGEELKRWREFLHNPELAIERSTLIEVYRAVVEYYGARPTRPSFGSSPGPKRTRPTSRAGARSKASTSGRSR